MSYRHERYGTNTDYHRAMAALLRDGWRSVRPSYVSDSCIQVAVQRDMATVQLVFIEYNGDFMVARMGDGSLIHDFDKMLEATA